MIKNLMMLVVAFCVAFGAWAETETVGDYTWTYRINDDTAEIFNDYSAAISPKPHGAVTIPSVLGGKSVTIIGDYAFYGCSGLTSVTIPDSVAGVGRYAFTGCTNLTGVYIADLTAWCKVHFNGGGDNPLEYAHNFYINGSLLEDLIIPDGVTSIGCYAFSGGSCFTSVTIPSGVTNIDAYAFYECTGLRAVHTPSLSDWCKISFYGKSDNPLAYAHNLYVDGNLVRALKIPEGVVRIGVRQFIGCTSIESVDIPDSVMSIAVDAFDGCNDAIFDTSTIPGLKLLDGWVIESSDAISGTLDLTEIRGIGWYAFYGCSGLTIVTIPDSVTSIWDYTFYNCSGLESVTIPNSVTSIGSSAFSGCSGLTSVTIPDSVTSIGGRAFYGCNGLTSVYVSFGDADRVKGLLKSSGCDVTKVNFLELGATYVVFDANGGVVAEQSRKVASDGPVGELPTPTRSGYTFAGWFTAANGGVQVNASTKVTSSVAFYAHWTVNQYTVTFNANGGTGGKSMKQNYGSAIVAPMVTRSGYTFAGWSPAVAATVPANNVTYNALWTKNQAPTPTPTPAPGPTPTPEPEETHVLFEEVDGEAPATAASEYNGYLYDEKSGAVKGTIQVKVGKPGKKDGKASIKATVVVGTKKVSLKGADKGKAAIAFDGPTEIELSGKGSEECVVTLGADGFAGFYGAYIIDGARNLFAPKDKADQNDAKYALDKWLGSLMVIWDGGSLSVSIASKGKVKISGTLANGTRVSASTVLLVGEECSCVSVVAQKANLAFVLWLSYDGKTATVEGLGDGVLVGKAGTLADGAVFSVSADAALWSAIPGTVLTEYLPDGVPVTKKGTKWTLPKAGRVTMKNGVIDNSKSGENPSGLKLTYKASDGTFKGTFKVYVENGGKLKATTVNVTGFMLDGVGYGTATIKKVGSVPILIE